MTDEIPPRYQDEHGGFLPMLPVPGDRVRILWAADPEEDMPQSWQSAYYLGENAAGIWWTPGDDRAGAMWEPWSKVVSIDGSTE